MSFGRLFGMPFPLSALEVGYQRSAVHIDADHALLFAHHPCTSDTPLVLGLCYIISTYHRRSLAYWLRLWAEPDQAYTLTW